MHTRLCARTHTHTILDCNYPVYSFNIVSATLLARVNDLSSPNWARRHDTRPLGVLWGTRFPQIDQLITPIDKPRVLWVRLRLLIIEWLNEIRSTKALFILASILLIQSIILFSPTQPASSPLRASFSWRSPHFSLSCPALREYWASHLPLGCPHPVNMPWVVPHSTVSKFPTQCEEPLSASIYRWVAPWTGIRTKPHFAHEGRKVQRII